MPGVDDSERLRHMLRHMLEACERALRLAQNRTRKDLDSDELFELAMLKLLEIVGEAASRVGMETRARHSDIPWSEIRGLRNRLIHAYDLVNRDVVWGILTNDLPSLARSIRAVLGFSPS